MRAKSLAVKVWKNEYFQAVAAVVGTLIAAIAGAFLLIVVGTICCRMAERLFHWAQSVPLPL